MGCCVVVSLFVLSFSLVLSSSHTPSPIEARVTMSTAGRQVMASPPKNPIATGASDAKTEAEVFASEIPTALPSPISLFRMAG